MMNVISKMHVRSTAGALRVEAVVLPPCCVLPNKLGYPTRKGYLIAAGNVGVVNAVDCKKISGK
jgi:hypothetical protein